MFDNKSEHFAGMFGKSIEATRNYEAALNSLGLDFSCSKQDIYFPTTDGDVSCAPDHVVVRKDDDNSVLGIVGKDFGLIQPIDAFRDAEYMMQLFPEIATVAGGTVDGGKQGWLHLSLPVTSEPVPGDIARYVLQISNGFAGAAAWRAALIMLREACINHSVVPTVRNSFMIRHTKNAASRLEGIRGLVRNAIDIAAEHVHVISRLATVRMDEFAIRDFTKALFPEDSQELARERILNLSYLGKGQDISGVRETAWAAFNAVTEYSEYWRGTEGRGRRSTQESRFQSVMKDDEDSLNNRAFVYLTAL